MVENAKNIGQSLARQRRIDEICDAFEAAFRRGESPDISAFLDGGPPGDRSELLTALVGLDFELRTTSDDSPRLSDYLADFPNETEAVKLAFEEAVLTDATVFSDPAKEETVSRHDHPSETLATAKGDAPGEFLIERIGRYEIGEVLGEGAFGRVYRARDPKLNREVALKVPTTNATKTDEATKRFAREGRAAAALRHPGICPVFELWDEGETPFIAMAFIEGETLAQRNRSRVYSSIDSVQMVRKLAIALAYAHNKGVVHRDLKPGNIMFDAEQGDPVILDFGLAHFPELDDSVLTQSGVVMGTPTHMSPEQTRGATDEIDERSDVYSLGVIFYELLTGELPFTGSVGEVLGKIQHVNPKLPSSINPEVDSRLEAICMHAMAKEPAKRFQSMEDFATELKRWEESISPTHEPSGAPETRSSFKRWLVVGAAAASILALILLAQSGVLLTVRTDAGTVLVQVDDAANTIRVDVSEDKTVSLTDPNDGQQIELTVDRERKLLQLEKSGFKIATTRFVLSGKDGQTVSVTFEPKAVMEEASDLSQASGPRGKPLHTNAIGFTVDAVQTHVDNDSMRLRTWNDTENLFVQAILWKDNDDRFGRSEDQETNNDRSTLLIDVDLDRQRTSGSDRFYWLTRTPSSHKMRYQVVTGPTRSTYLRSDSRAYGQIRYHSVNDKPRVRVDTYVIPLNEIGISPGEKIGIAYWGCSPLPALVVNSVGFVPKKEEMYYPADLPWEEFHEVHLQRVENDRDVASASTNLEPAGEESSSTPRVPEVVLSPSVTTSSMSELVQNGVAGFSASEAQALVETESLRLHTCHDGTNLVVQAILWQDDDETFGKSNDPLLSQKRLADRSMLVFDVDSNRRLTPGIDRKYYLDWSQRFRGMLYQVRGTTGYYVFKRDSEGYGAIQYFETGSDRKVRVDTYVIPLKEIGVAPGEVIGVGFAAGSISPKLEIKSTVADSLVNESTSLDQLGFESLHQVRLQRKDADPLQITEQIWPRDQPAPAIVPFTAEEAKEHQEAWARHLQVPVGFKNSIGMRFRVIPPGEFLMGSSEAEIAKLTEETKDKSRSDWYAERLPSEGPQRKVVLSKPFALAVHEVSRGQFRKFVVATGYKTEGEKDGRGGAGFTNGILRLRAPEFLWNTDLGFETEPNDDHPVVNISWEDATAFCDWLSEKEGVRCRLPTEAEWEFACRAGSLARFHAGNDEAEVREFAWIENEGGVGTHPVGTKTANAFGLFDLHGNVWEWCGEKFGRYNPTEVVDPVGPLIGELRVLRGGAFSKDAAFARSAYRTHIIPDYRDCSCGFRVVRTFESFP